MASRKVKIELIKQLSDLREVIDGLSEKIRKAASEGVRRGSR